MPIDGFLDGTAHSDCSPFLCMVTLLRYSVPGWSICTTKLQVNFPFRRESSEFTASEGWVVICE